ncbi:hypothetical protein A0256_19940 [Mucilaginibacter sp. PAMC 26640]|nr:hypothetical protein A0256_19940 [Mucilaginibacter sp. PAMC 26640]
MNKHHGKIIEYTLRKNDYNISDLAKSMNVNRRTLYNWFAHEKIKKDIVFRIGCIIRHDFSKQFPEMFTSDDFNVINLPKTKQMLGDEDNFWKNKYMALLNEYNRIAERHLKIV